jgi:hypothetical protein
LNFKINKFIVDFNISGTAPNGMLDNIGQYSPEEHTAYILGLPLIPAMEHAACEMDMLMDKNKNTNVATNNQCDIETIYIK